MTNEQLTQQIYDEADVMGILTAEQVKEQLRVQRTKTFNESLKLTLEVMKDAIQKMIKEDVLMICLDNLADPKTFALDYMLRQPEFLNFISTIGYEIIPTAKGEKWATSYIIKCKNAFKYINQTYTIA